MDSHGGLSLPPLSTRHSPQDTRGTGGNLGRKAFFYFSQLFLAIIPILKRPSVILIAFPSLFDLLPFRAWAEGLVFVAGEKTLGVRVQGKGFASGNVAGAEEGNKFSRRIKIGGAQGN